MLRFLQVWIKSHNYTDRTSVNNQDQFEHLSTRTITFIHLLLPLDGRRERVVRPGATLSTPLIRREAGYASVSVIQCCQNTRGIQLFHRTQSPALHSAVGSVQ
ncbi:hypothetical protein HETIRDRAFT_428303 [Heterobasidion irregulare TC 32-1]|uniref:Uncharacterized protein n=1 Tax=Heterobasidion irregulare (strain TC 32-1) TaxID=747525 RepID=W4K3P4_HETIT|nr:uncharacterized protein HETIRDRAFT_428303 [Heterobasidion irregulare TC 32-1]ETW79960.1 hypothetical protein HETIRDRAFT_428303 [Heterobasidion irregulare TC 32-1]